MDTVETLKAARALIDTPEKWWQKKGDEYRAGRHCAITALDEVGGVRATTGPAIPALARAIGGWTEEPVLLVRTITSFNDSHSHAEVLAAFDRAIEVEEARAAEHNVPGVYADLTAHMHGMA